MNYMLLRFYNSILLKLLERHDDIKKQCAKSRGVIPEILLKRRLAARNSVNKVIRRIQAVQPDSQLEEI